jgi:hypothetical protein
MSRTFIFLIIVFLVHHPLTEMTSNSLHMQWPLTSQLHGSFVKQNNFFITEMVIHARMNRQKHM